MSQTRIYDTQLHVSEEGAQDGSRVVPTNTVLAVVRGMSLAKEFRVALTKREVAFNQDLKALECSPEIDSGFLFYSLFAQRDRIRELATEASHGTKKLETDLLGAVEILLPAIDVQRRIVEVAAAYDDLIENNSRRTALFEDAARRLYEEWFVRLRFPGREHTPMVDGVPRGWQRRSLGNCATFLSGGTPSKARSDFWEGDIPWVSSGELTALRIDDASLHVTEEGVEAGSRLVPPKTILAVVRGMSLAKEFRLAMTSKTVCFNQDLKAIVAADGVDADFLFHTLVSQRDAIRDRAGEASHGTKKIDTPVLASTPIILPPPMIQTAFSDFVTPLNAQWDNLNRQSAKLRAARDLLLPRLMSGEVAA